MNLLKEEDSKKNLETACPRLSVPLLKIGTRMGASLSSIRKDRNQDGRL